jgi:hypothetical protein
MMVFSLSSMVLSPVSISMLTKEQAKHREAGLNQGLREIIIPTSTEGAGKIDCRLRLPNI